MNKLETGHDRTLSADRYEIYKKLVLCSKSILKYHLYFNPFDLLLFPIIAQAMNRVQLRFYAALSS